MEYCLKKEKTPLSGEEDDDDDYHQWKQLMANIPADPPSMRDICPRCNRPETVCFCADIKVLSSLRNHLIILQHPNELKRCLRTTKILELSLPKNHYHSFNGKRFSDRRKFFNLHKLIQERETILLYPSNKSQPLNSFSSDQAYNVIMLDGTWSQARVLYNVNRFLWPLRAVQLNASQPSQYVIRTQPTEICLSTVEAAASVLAHLESDQSIVECLTRPLKTICDYQLNKGAVQHQSKEFLLNNGLYTKPLNKKVQKRLDNEKKNLAHLLDR